MLQELLLFLQSYSLWVATGVALLVILLLVLQYLRKTKFQRAIQSCLKKVSIEYLANIIIPDGLGEYIDIDYLLLTPKGLLVIDSYRMNGNIFGAEKLDHWTQMTQRRSNKFENPLRGNDLRVLAVRAMAGSAPVVGRVLYTNDSHFPKGRPPGVSTINSFEQDMAQYLIEGEPSDSILLAWDMIKGTAANATVWKEKIA